MFVYQSDLYCDGCGAKLMSQLDDQGIVDSGDTDDFPQFRHPLECESDQPQYCAVCHEFLGNPLTDAGRDYVHRLVFNYYHGLLPWISEDAVEEVRRFYGIPMPY